jgi:glycosyltransferase involved in cell wall biosynthesis
MKSTEPAENIVSCIVPVLNEKDTIMDYILSLHNQDYRPIELIVVDGGSVDGTVDIVKKAVDDLNDDYFSINLFKEKNFGTITSPANARNIGLDNAGGEFVFFIDSDTRFIDNSTISTAISEMGNRDFIILDFKPLIDTKLEEHISKIIKSGVLVIRKKLMNGKRFIPTLGFGEDREFYYRWFGGLSFFGEVPCSINIGRHYPHTKNELRKQNEWYGRTIVNYLKAIYNLNKKEFLSQCIYLIYNILLGIFPFGLLISLIISYKLVLIFLSLFIAQTIILFFKYGFSTLGDYIFLMWYSLYNGFFFTKGLFSNIYRKNVIGRT